MGSEVVDTATKTFWTVELSWNASATMTQRFHFLS